MLTFDYIVNLKTFKWI